MNNTIDLTSRVLNPKDIYWSIDISSDEQERFGISLNPANDQVMIFVYTKSFERIPILKDRALKEARKQFAEGTIER